MFGNPLIVSTAEPLPTTFWEAVHRTCPGAPLILTRSPGDGCAAAVVDGDVVSVVLGEVLAEVETLPLLHEANTRTGMTASSGGARCRFMPTTVRSKITALERSSKPCPGPRNQACGRAPWANRRHRPQETPGHSRRSERPPRPG